MRRSVSRFMPGERAEDAIRAAVRQREDGMGAILTFLGENLTTAAAAEEVTEQYLRLLDDAQWPALDAHISVKLTQLGLDLDKELCYSNLRQLLDRAAGRRSLVWLDMESSRYVDPTLALFRRAREHSRLVGVALQAYLRRTAEDLEALLPGGGCIRLVKGAYLEPPDLAFPRKTDVDENFYRLACRALAEQRDEAVLHLATHDLALIDRLNAHIARHGIASSGYEYAMLYGIRAPLQRQLVAAGQRLRVLISYGEHWFPWYMRRLAERPANFWFVVRSVVARD